jgi:hypothetical protein
MHGAEASFMHRIVILTHELDYFEKMTHLLHGVSKIWRQDDIEVVVLRGTEKFVDGDVAINHVDLTVTPDEYLRFMKRYPLTLNAAVKDISKRSISRSVVSRGDGYKGPVIVKTNCNFGGGREGEIAQQSVFSKYARALRRRLPWTMRAEIDTWKYPIFGSVKEVPRMVWHNPDLMIEKFQPEKQGEFYCMRAWCFLGDAEENVIMYAKQPIIKSAVAVKIEPAPVPDELREIRRELQFDYGKFDYGIANGRVVLYDANRTPAVRNMDANVPLFKVLARGIEQYLQSPLKIAG